MAVCAALSRVTNIRTSYGFGQPRRASATVAVQVGEFYDGDLTQRTLANRLFRF